MDKPSLRVDEAARLLNVSRWTIYRWVKQGRLEVRRARAGLRIVRASLVALIDQGRRPVGMVVREAAGPSSHGPTRGTSGL
jgi:excisionase family DNA binding protein